MKKIFSLVLFISYASFINGMENNSKPFSYEKKVIIKQRSKFSRFKALLSYGLELAPVQFCDNIIKDFLFLMPGGGFNAENKYHQFKEKIGRLVKIKSLSNSNRLTWHLDLEYK